MNEITKLSEISEITEITEEIGKLANSFLLRVYTQHDNIYIHLQDVRTAKTQIFSSWTDALQYIQEQSEVEGLR